MSGPSNLSRARSHIIFIISLLAACAYILWVEQGRGIRSESTHTRPAAVSAPEPIVAHVPQPAPTAQVAADAPPEGWRVQLGAFRTAEAAGRRWDAIRGSVPELQPMSIMIVESDDVVRLQAGPLRDQREVERVCGLAQAAGVECSVVTPIRAP